MMLTEFLEARIAEDVAVARAARTPHSWAKGNGYNGWSTVRAESSQSSVFVAELEDSADAAHIVRHDPARVLAECEAKRRIVEKAKRADVAFGQQINPATSAASFALTEVLHYLALPYADHPDWREEWRV